MSAVSGARSRPAAIELATGFVVLLFLLALLAVAIVGREHKGGDGYTLHAVFNQVDGLDIGSDVKLAGITVGHVTSETVDPKGFRAAVGFTVRDDITLPQDSAAIITSDSLLGGKYIALSPGGSEASLKPGATMIQTQGSISLEQLLSKFIFSVTDSLQKTKKPAGGASSDAGGDDLP